VPSFIAQRGKGGEDGRRAGPVDLGERKGGGGGYSRISELSAHSARGGKIRAIKGERPLILFALKGR